MPFDFLSVGFIPFGVGNESSSLRGGLARFNTFFNEGKL